MGSQQIRAVYKASATGLDTKWTQDPFPQDNKVKVDVEDLT